MIDVRRLGHATLTTPDLDRQVEYYSEILGLSLYEKDSKRAVLGTRTGLECIVLEKGETMHLPHLAFQVAPGSDLGEVAAKAKAEGLKVERRSGITPGVREAITFEDPKGTLLELFSEYEFQPDDGKQSTITIQKLGHVAYRVTDLPKVMKFYTDFLNFRLSDSRSDFFVFLRCGVDHHTVNFVTDEQQRLHHIAFEVRDWAEIHKACDFLGKHDLHLVWGPGRHNIGHNVAIYHMNWDRVRVELYTEMDQMKDETLGYFDPRPWHGDRPQRPKTWGPETLRNYWGFGSERDLNKNL
jgi:catechol 2,3-dioxygenase-like lactoylglutathione lyase family enzyme